MITDYRDCIEDPAFKRLSDAEQFWIIQEGKLKGKQDAMKARQDAKRVKAAKPKSNAKTNGKFKWRPTVITTTATTTRMRLTLKTQKPTGWRRTAT